VVHSIEWAHQQAACGDEVLPELHVPLAVAGGPSASHRLDTEGLLCMAFQSEKQYSTAMSVSDRRRVEISLPA